MGYGRSGLVAIELGMFDEPLVRLLEEALGALEDDESALRAGVLGNLAMAVYWSPSRERRASLSRQAVEMARRIGDPATLAASLASMHFALSGAEGTAEQLATAREIVRLSEQVGDVEMALQGRVWEISTLLELGDIAAANAQIAVYTRRAEELRQPRYLAFAGACRIMQALLEGRFEQANELIEHGLPSAQARSDHALMQTLGMLSFVLSREKGGLQQLEAPIAKFLDQYPAIPGWRCVLANLYGHLGREVEARREFERAAANDFHDLPEDLTWFFVVVLLSETCAFLGDARRAALLYELLLPYARNYVVLSAVVCVGSASRYLGLLAGTMDRWDEVTTHFEDAIAMNARIGARPWLAHCQHDQAAMLVKRNDPRSLDRARHLLARASETAEELGMKTLVERSLALELAAGTGVSASPSLEGNVFSCEGEYWTIVYEGSLVRLKEAKGFHYIARLLRYPGRQFHCRELAAGVANFALAGDGAGPVLDTKAKAEYRRRVLDLRGELEEGERFNDSGRVARARDEIQFITDQLKAALGLGGRDRRVASHAERARLLVTQAIKAAVKKIGRRHPALAEHFVETLRTGYHCEYRADRAHPVSWRL